MLSDVELKAAVPDFLLSRLKLSEPPTSTESTAPSATERHCFLEKSFGDEYDTLLCDPPPVALETVLDGVERKGTPIWLSQPVDVPSSIVIPTSEVQASTDTTPPADVRESVPAGGSGAVAVRVLKTATSSPKKDAKQLKGGSTKPAKPGQIKAKP
ncbi:hypothetical protein H310_10640 [Aphanomyces invadans]|uniref:Uncharacterized protein n=1 Tax=Aphanomyces invadans TaxID=157072 RepID=A0A024TPP3_9STRA|nr:hypothetical protein H310_10640 [Aphanomyces invadans]ETV95983.1 hypothetical protein H310_10640 [Aphanomyces invadans]|eukprot:XP_008875294.1 hypothetical protein H310_10640 [Aphanomyces invadans]